MKSKYVYEDPMDLLKEAHRILKKIRFISATDNLLTIVGGEPPSARNTEINRVTVKALKDFEESFPELKEES